MEFISEYGLFFAKVITVVIAIIVVIAAIAAQAIKNKSSGGLNGHIDVKNINDHFKDFEDQMHAVILSDEKLKELHKIEKKADKKREKEEKKHPVEKSKLYVLNFDGDVKASELEFLRQEITAILLVAKKDDEVLIVLESPGGMVHTYGLAASQLKRIRDAGIKLTVCVDKVAASGGYMMACVADTIYAAPFAIVGSIGVLAQIPNFNRALKKLDVDYEILTAGEYKAPISMFGEITDKGRNKLKEELEDTHVLFKEFINIHRPQVDIDTVATGEVWYGQRAIANHLVDGIQTSDDYLMSCRFEKDIFEVTFVERKSLQEKLGMAFHQGFAATINLFIDKNQQVAINKNIQ